MTDLLTRWVDICCITELRPERGRAVLVEGAQVAVFRTIDNELFAVGNRCPTSGADVMAHGRVGTRRDRPAVASPVNHQVFDLRTGACLDDGTVRLPTYRVRLVGDRVEVASE